MGSLLPTLIGEKEFPIRRRDSEEARYVVLV
jgi:hypothetical protein